VLLFTTLPMIICIVVYAQITLKKLLDMKKICLLLFALALLSFAYKQKTKTKVYLIGDSTMSIKETKVYPETGWGMPFAYFFDSTIEVDNRAKNGRSTRTFISENRWQPLADNLQEGDYVFIQFGHNDESKEKTDRYTTPEQFKINLTKFVTETRAKKASPILIKIFENLFEILMLEYKR
jgi:lysophospholipase L1-like esterase